jgi:hypothetical protein
MTYPDHIIAQAREIAERHGMYQRGGVVIDALCEALTTTPPSEEAMTKSDVRNDRTTDPKPEPTEDHLRRACEELGFPVYPDFSDRSYTAVALAGVRTVARLLAERDAMQAEVESWRTSTQTWRDKIVEIQSALRALKLKGQGR